MNTLKELLADLPVTLETAPLILGMAVAEINKAPIDYRTRLRTFNESAEAVKERLKHE